ncbi:hypothetical protein Pve01_59180 [Planomonospora venezuelensis]|nr:hypothetical protein Pve01_59180 [Planomonospora venezuelensis]
MYGDDAATLHAWAALGGRDGLAEGVSYEGPEGVLSARLPVRARARASVGVCSLAAAEPLADGAPVPPRGRPCPGSDGLRRSAEAPGSALRTGRVRR